MTTNLIFRAATKFFLGVLVTAMLIFIPAGTIRFYNGWLLMGILFFPMLVAGLVLAVKNPQLLEKRLNAKEKRKEQNLVVKLSGLMFVAGFILGGLNFRFAWTSLPPVVVQAAAGVFLVGYGLYAEVLRENTYLSRTVEVQVGQRVIDTGLYGIVRHPMYSATVLLFLAIPLVLGSILSFGIFLFYLPIIAMRIKNEEALLRNELLGYIQYCEKVRYRLVPFVW
ncbi:MAG: isoprenylcysteine carboxylmethyltransferase family protein [Spirochaetaceae bacterium]|nr:isoprenylcysteine carboxylmethyltransferase family protein [Spirochaetaceae bacterium]